MRSPLALLFDDLAVLFNARAGRLWFGLVAALLLQTGYWYLGSPGPELLRLAVRTPLGAGQNIGWALLLLGLVPLALLRLLGLSPATVGLRLGDARFGLAVVALGALVAVPLMAVAAGDPALQAVYPWAGAWPGSSPAALLTWAAAYALYYVAFEFFYRGFLLRLVEAHWGLVAALWVQTLASTMIHLGKPLTETLAAIPAGLLFGVMAVRGRSILYPLLLHLCIGLAIDVAALWHQGLLRL